MLFMNGGTAVEVGNRAGYLKNAGIGTGRETETVGYQLKHAVAGGVQFAVFFYETGSHLGVAVDFGPFVALQLDFTGLFYTLGDCCRAFGFATVGEVTVFNRRYFDVDVDAVKQRAGNAGTVAVNGNRSAGAGVSRVG